MNKIAGVAIDPYDDGFLSLKDFFTNSSIPDFIKSASIHEAKEIEILPDHAFAVVIVGQGEPMRKYACVDKAHTAVNVLYLIKNAENIPSQVKSKAASNLAKACCHYGLEPPAALLKMAKGGKVLIKGDGAELVVPGGEKRSELVGTGLMPITRPGQKQKVAHLMDSPYVEITEWDSPKVKEASYDTRTSVLNGQLSLLPYDNVVKARDYFEENYKYMHPRERHDYCVKLAARANQLGIPTSDTVKKYGATTYGTVGSVKVAFETRSQIWKAMNNKSGESVASELFEKRASYHPEEFAEALADLDASTGIDQYWDNGIPDPWMSTFGQEKVAEWKWHQGGEYLTEDALKRLVSEETGLLREKFGDDLANGLVKSPTSIFDSLPLNHKRVIARMAQQQESGI